MTNHYKIILLFFLFLINEKSYTQNNYTKIKKIFPATNTIVIDSLPINYKSFRVLKDKIEINPELYSFNYKINELYIDSTLLNDSITIFYKILNPNIKISLRDSSLYIPIIEKEPDFLNTNIIPKTNSELYTNGSFVRNFSNGNNQNLSINTDVDLRISGKINNNLFVDGFISDNSLPLQYGESSSSLQELDKIYIKLYNSQVALTGGDVEINNIENHFLKFSRKAIGLDFEKKDSTNKIISSIGMTKNIFKRQTILVQNGNQGPYKLVGENNEPYILVISNSESVFIDGVKKNRGSDKDYLINYNTGEISFTNNIILNTNNRVIIEFQYTNQNYFKWLGYTGFYKKKENLDYYFNFYTESDNKNSPINPLNEEEVFLLSNSGDNNALINSFNEVDFNPDLQQILYIKKDTTDLNNITHKNIFVFSNNHEDSLFQVTFSNVGNGNGNYILESSLVNGAVFKWIPPINGQSQGNYSPTKILIPAKKTQMMSFGGNYKKNTTNISFDIGISNKDQNLFSSSDDNNNVGIGTRFSINKIITRNNLHILPEISYEYINKKFSFIERTRELEFNRNWDINNTPENQQLINFSLKTSLKENIKLNYNFENMRRLNSNKIRNSIDGLIQKDSLIINIGGSLLNSLNEYEDLKFIKHKNSIIREGKFSMNILNEGEILKSDNSTSFNKLFISSSIKNSLLPLLKIDYTNRIDKNNLLQKSTENSIAIQSTIVEKNKIKSNLQISYSDFMSYTNDSLINENNINNRLDYFLNPNSFIKINGFFELSSGRESLREIRYVKVNAGYGNYSWVDYNNNNIEEFDEFEISHFSDTADYTKISFPTNEYFDVKNTKISQQIKINPKTTRTKGIIHKLCFFENLSNIEINRKIASDNWGEILSPFFKNKLENILSLSFNLNNTLMYRPKNKNMFISYKIDKSLFRNSFSWDKQLSERLIHNICLKINFVNFSTKTNLYYNENKITNENLIYQNCQIRKNGLDFEFISNHKYLKPSILISYYQKENISSVEKLDGFKIGSKFLFNSKSEYLLKTDLTFYHINYIGEINNSISYQMLDGLSAGNGLKWGATLTKKINKLTFSLKYSGEVNAINDIHYAHIELKKYF